MATELLASHTGTRPRFRKGVGVLAVCRGCGFVVVCVWCFGCLELECVFGLRPSPKISSTDECASFTDTEHFKTNISDDGEKQMNAMRLTPWTLAPYSRSQNGKMNQTL